MEYYYGDSATLQLDAAHFDIHLSPDNFQGIKTLSPKSLAVLYNIWREQYANDDPGAVKERRKIESWCQANGKNPEDFYCHYGSDVTIRSDNLATGSPEISVIPGWDPANDLNNDGRRDMPSDYGLSTSVGSARLSDASKDWAAGRWAGAILVDKNGNVYSVVGNTATTLSLSTGYPAAGRYGLSAAGSANPLATAGTRFESRAKSYIWQNYAYAMNLGNLDYQRFRAYDAHRVLIDADQAWDESASAYWDGYMVDNTGPDFPWAEVLDGKDSVIEYPDRSLWSPNQVSLFQAVRDAVGPGKYVWGNTGSYLYDDIGLAGGGQHQEQFVAITNEHGPVQWDYWKKLSDQRLYSLVMPSWDCWPEDSDRERIHYLAFHYIGQQPYIYLGFRGFGYANVYHWPATPYEWLPACETDIGTPVDDLYTMAASGKDPAGQTCNIYIRHYSKALIVCRPKLDWSEQNYGDNSGVVFSLPSYTTSSGTTNMYQPLKADGSLGAAVSKVTLRLAESFILMQSAATAPPPAKDTTPPQISGVTTSTGTTTATISWTTTEPSAWTVDYGLTTSYGARSQSTTMSTSGKAALTGLLPGKTYHFRITCTDALGNAAATADRTFVTSGDSRRFLADWLLLGPFKDQDPIGASSDFIGEATAKPTTDQLLAGKKWTAYHSSTQLVDLKGALGSSTYCAAYAHVYINSQTAQSCLLKLGSDDGVKVWLNGTMVFRHLLSRSAGPDQDTVSINLLKGWNRLLIKVTQEDGGWGFYARLVNPTSGLDATGLTYQLSAPAPAPYIRNWLLIGPFPNPNRLGYEMAYLGANPNPQVGQVVSGRTWRAHSSTGDLIDLGALFTPKTYVVAYAAANVISPTAQTVQLRTGSSDGIRVVVNGVMAFSKKLERTAVKDADITPIALNAGVNTLLVKIDQVQGSWGFYARICDPSGMAVPGLSFQ